MKRVARAQLERHITLAATKLRAVAMEGVFDGTPKTESYLARCRFVSTRANTCLTFTRDVGHHESGWFKNPDYERCFHLSLSEYLPEGIVDRRGRHSSVYDRQVRNLWLEAFFQDDLKKTWVEPPMTGVGKRLDVWHWRLFCDEAWAPITPRGEVYTTQFTQAGWMSHSEYSARKRSNIVRVS